MYTNADSLTNKMNDFKVRVMENNPDIIAVLETWIQEKQSSKYYWTNESLELEDYQLIRKDNPNTKKGGILVYVKNTLEVDLNVPKQIQDLSSAYIDCLWINIKSTEETILFGCIYRRPCSTLQQDIIVRDMLDKASKSENILICGDFNFKEINWANGTVDGSTYSKQNKFYNCIEDNFLEQHVTEFTRKRGSDKPSTLDLIITKMDQSQTQIAPSLVVDPPLGKSDHATLKWNYLLDVKPITDTQENKIIKKNYYKGDYDTLRDLCKTTNWDKELGLHDNSFESTDLESTLEHFYDIVKDYEDKTVPLSTGNGKRTHNPPG